MKECLTEPGFTREVTIKLRNFGIQQQALAKELLEAKPLGICKIITSRDQRLSFKSLDSILRSGNVSMKIDITLTKENPKEMLLSTLNEQERVR